MIPWFDWTFVTVFGVQVKVFGVLAGMGTLIGAKAGEAYGRRVGIPLKHSTGFVLTCTIAGLLGAMLFVPLAYDHALLQQIVADPSLVFRRFLGLSSFGGFFTGAAAG